MGWGPSQISNIVYTELSLAQGRVIGRLSAVGRRNLLKDFLAGLSHSGPQHWPIENVPLHLTDFKVHLLPTVT